MKAKLDFFRELGKGFGRLLKRYLPFVHKRKAKMDPYQQVLRECCPIHFELQRPLSFLRVFVPLAIPTLIAFVTIVILAIPVQADKSFKLVPVDPSQLFQPPITNAMPNIKMLQPLIAPPAAAKLVAVPDEVERQKSEEKTIPSQEDYALLTPTTNDTSLFGDGVVLIPENRLEDYIPPPDTFIYSDELPQVIVQVKPERTKEMDDYLFAADLDSIKVVVKVFVDNKGDVRAWKILRPPGDDGMAELLGLEKEVIRVVQKWKFTPAIRGTTPVGVWTVIPFNMRFK